MRHCAALVMTCVLLAFAPAASLGAADEAAAVAAPDWLGDLPPPTVTTYNSHPARV
jgi:hypothetical protein